MEKLIITVAPTGSVPRKRNTPYLLVTPKEIAETLQREVATPEEARRILGLKPR